jgi:hypothetical protein
MGLGWPELATKPTQQNQGLTKGYEATKTLFLRRLDGYALRKSD